MVVLTTEPKQVKENNVQQQNNVFDPSLPIFATIDFSNMPKYSFLTEFGVPDYFMPCTRHLAQNRLNTSIVYIPLTVTTSDKKLPPRPKYVIQKKQKLMRGKHKRSYR